MAAGFFDLVDFDRRSLYIAASAIAFNPLFWNTAARLEYRRKLITSLCNGNPRLGCYCLAITIFCLGIFRDLLYERALRDQPTLSALASPAAQMTAYALIAGGNVLVLSSMWALGITGTYLGDYFGILMDHRVETFPFNVTGAPMYYGSTLSFLGTALLYAKPAGFLLTLEVLTIYLVALRFEDPFTARIYEKRAQEEAKTKKKT